jgi:hypothetical protein
VGQEVQGVRAQVHTVIRVTRLVCENAQNVPQPIFCQKLLQNFFRGKK